MCWRWTKELNCRRLGMVYMKGLVLWQRLNRISIDQIPGTRSTYTVNGSALDDIGVQDRYGVRCAITVPLSSLSRFGPRKGKLVSVVPSIGSIPLTLMLGDVNGCSEMVGATPGGRLSCHS